MSGRGAVVWVRSGVGLVCGAGFVCGAALVYGAGFACGGGPSGQRGAGP